MVRKIGFRSAIIEAIKEEMLRDSRVFMMGEDIEYFYPRLKEDFSDRILNTPISESAMVGAGVGATLNGMRPIVELMFSSLLPLCMDHLVNSARMVCYQYGGEVTCPMVVRASVGATGRGLGLHHSQSPESFFLNAPGLKIVMPSTPRDAKGLLKSAIRDNSPVVFLEHKLLREREGSIPDEEFIIPLGKADVKRVGEDVTIVATAQMLHKSLEAANSLHKEGISCEVIDLRTLLPLDENTILKSVKKTSRLITVQESPKAYGYGAEIAAIVAEKALGYLDAPVMRVANPGTPVPGTVLLEQVVIPNVEDIIRVTKEVV